MSIFLFAISFFTLDITSWSASDISPLNITSMVTLLSIDNILKPICSDGISRLNNSAVLFSLLVAPSIMPSANEVLPTDGLAASTIKSDFLSPPSILSSSR